MTLHLDSYVTRVSPVIGHKYVEKEKECAEVIDESELDGFAKRRGCHSPPYDCLQSPEGSNRFETHTCVCVCSSQNSFQVQMLVLSLDHLCEFSCFGDLKLTH